MDLYIFIQSAASNHQTRAGCKSRTRDDVCARPHAVMMRAIVIVQMTSADLVR
jgi:hypothetical protein